MRKRSRQKAFTLAEVLITLGIIGIVAAMTIPVLMNNTNNKETVNAVKKAYAVFSQALKLAEIENGTIDSWGCTDSSCFFNKLTPYLAVAQNCGLATEQGCFPLGVNYQKIGGGDQFTGDNNAIYPKAKLKDGMIFTMDLSSGNSTCSGIDTANLGNSALNSVCGALYVDVNGNKPPNTLGMDFFAFWFTRAGIYPAGTIDDSSRSLSTDCSNKSGVGFGCTAWVLYKENMDYLKGVVSW